MANPEKGEVALKVGEQEYVLVFSIDAICQLEEKAKSGMGIKGVKAILSEMADTETQSISLARLMLWAALREHHREITVLQAGQMIVPAGGIGVVLPLVFEAIRLAFPGGDSEDPPAVPSRSAGSAD